MFHSAVYITFRSGLGPVKNGKCEDPMVVSNVNQTF